MASDVDLCNRALLTLGAAAISSLADGTDRANVCADLYPATRDQCLTMHPWRFTMDKKQLNRLTATPVNVWEYAFQLPTDRIAAPRAVFNSTDTSVQAREDFEIFGDKLFWNFDTCVIDYQKETGESFFPVWFQQLVVWALAGQIAMEVTDKDELTREYNERAFGTPSEGGVGGYFLVCTEIEARGKSPAKMDTDEIVDARFA